MIERAKGFKFNHTNFDILRNWGITNYTTVFDLEEKIQASAEQLTNSQTENKARSHTRLRARAHTLPPRERTHMHTHAHAHTHTTHTHTGLGGTTHQIAR